MKRPVSVCLCVLALLALFGCSPANDAYHRHIQQLQDQNRQIKQERDAAAGLLNVSGFALVVTGCALAACLFVLRRGGREDW